MTNRTTLAPGLAPALGELTKRDRERLRGVDPDLCLVVELARRDVEFIVTEGLRTLERQRQLLLERRTTTLRSKHLVGRAVDLCPLVRGAVSWKHADFDPVAAAMKSAALKLGVRLVWGGDWKTFIDCPHFELAGTAAAPPPASA